MPVNLKSTIQANYIAERKIPGGACTGTYYSVNNLQKAWQNTYSYLNLSIIDKSKYSSQMKETFGEYIRNLRVLNNLTLTQLAAKLDMDSANLSKIENGKREFDFKRLDKLSQTFQLDIKALTEEYLSEKFAKTIIETKTNSKVFQLAEQKVEYFYQKNSKQGSIKF